MLRDPTQQHCFQGEGEGKNRLATKFRKNAPQVCNFLNSFVQDCSLLMHAQKNKTKQNKTSTVGLKQTCDLHSNTGIRHKYLLVEALHSLLENVLSSLSWHQSSIYPLSYEHP